MNTSTVFLLTAALQLSQAVPPTDESQQGGKDVQEVLVIDENPEENANRQKPDEENGLQAELDRLLQLQSEIESLLDAAQAYDVPEKLPTEKEQANRAASSAAQKPAHDENSQALGTLNAMAAADALYLSGKYADAYQLYQNAEAKDTNDSCWILYQQANCKRWLSKTTEAVDRYQQIITEFPDSFWAKEAEWWIQAIQWQLTFSDN